MSIVLVEDLAEDDRGDFKKEYLPGLIFQSGIKKLTGLTNCTQR